MVGVLGGMGILRSNEITKGVFEVLECEGMLNIGGSMVVRDMRRGCEAGGVSRVRCSRGSRGRRGSTKRWHRQGVLPVSLKTTSTL